MISDEIAARSTRRRCSRCRDPVWSAAPSRWLQARAYRRLRLVRGRTDDGGCRSQELRPGDVGGGQVEEVRRPARPLGSVRIASSEKPLACSAVIGGGIEEFPCSRP